MNKTFGLCTDGWWPVRIFDEEVSALIASRIAAKAAHSSEDTWLLVHINDERWPPEELQGVIADESRCRGIVRRHFSWLAAQTKNAYASF